MRRAHHAHRAALVAAVALAAPAAGAQDVPAGAAPPPCPVADAAAARDAGAGAAGRPAVAGYAVAGFVAGVPVGFMAPLAVGEGGFGPGDPETQILAVGAAGVGATLAVAGRRATLPPARAEQVRGCAAEARAAFEQAYATRLRQRRLRAAAWGGATGAAAGLGFLFWLVAQVAT